jgi:cbb3-type cytochrome oxidase subunit 1
VQGAHVQRHAELDQLLGLAGIIVAAAITLPLGFTTSKEYAELEWPIDIAIAVVWVVFTVNLMGTILKRREKHMYVAIWFYIATAITVAMLHIVNSLAMPVAVQELLDLRRRAGRAGAVVVRPQRRRVLPHHAVPRADVLLPAQGGQPSGLSATGSRSSISGR